MSPRKATIAQTENQEPKTTTSPSTKPTGEVGFAFCCAQEGVSSLSHGNKHYAVIDGVVYLPDEEWVRRLVAEKQIEAFKG